MSYLPLIFNEIIVTLQICLDKFNHLIKEFILIVMLCYRYIVHILMSDVY